MLTHSIGGPQLDALLRAQQRWCVSIFLPLGGAGAAGSGAQAVLGNLLREARKRLDLRGVRHPVADALLEPAQALVQERPFRRHHGDGLALFLSCEGMRRHELPLAFEPLVVVSDRFHVTPLVPLMTGDGRFDILALSQNRVRLFTASRHDIEQVVLPDLPQSMEEALGADDPDVQFQFHTASSAALGHQPSSRIGHGVGVHDAKTDVARFLRRVDRAVSHRLREDEAPLVLAGVAYLLAIYRDVGSYPNVAGPVIEGNPDDLEPEKLHSRAWPVAASLFDAPRQEAHGRHRDLHDMNSPLWSGELDAIVPAAHRGRVATLFLAAETAAGPPTGDHAEDDLPNLATVHTLLNGGAVYALPSAQLPGSGTASAELRY